MKKLLAIFFVCFLLKPNFLLAEGKAMVSLYEGTSTYYKNKIQFKSPDPKFKDLLETEYPLKLIYPEGVKDWKGYNKKYLAEKGKPCFSQKRGYTYDGKQYTYTFIYKKGYGQDNLCINEIYKISAGDNSNIYGVVGMDVNGKAVGKVKGKYAGSYETGFAILAKNTLKKLCIKAASSKGVIKECYDPAQAVTKLGQIVNTRIDALKMREQAKGNIISTSEPIETSVTDTLGPKINVPGKLVAKNDQIILTGKITDESTIASVKIDNTSIALKNDGSFEQPLFVPLDGLKVSIEAIDKFTNKTSRTIIISREQELGKTEVAQLPSLNPTTISAQERPNAIALIIGITNYKSIPISVYADRDAKLFADYAYRSLGVSRNKIKLLVNDTASYIEIKKSLKRWLKNEVKENETEVYVFFAGHGLVSNNQKDLYLIPYDGETSLLNDTSIKRSELFGLIEENNPSSITAFFDTCYSGLTRQNKMLIADARPVIVVADETELSENITLISAASNNEIAGGLKGAEHGIFSYYLMEGLSGKADTDQNKNITVGELHAYVAQKVKESSAKLGREQNPQVSGDKEKILVRLN